MTKLAREQLGGASCTPHGVSRLGQLLPCQEGSFSADQPKERHQGVQPSRSIPR
jgi:hypothetical protein